MIGEKSINSPQRQAFFRSEIERLEKAISKHKCHTCGIVPHMIANIKRYKSYLVKNESSVPIQSESQANA